MRASHKPPAWFWVLGAVLLLWGVVGVAGFHMDLAMTAADRAKLDPYDQQLYASRPTWLIACYGIAVWSGLIGTVLLLARKGLARALYIVSILTVILMFGFMFVTTDIIAHKGVILATGLPIVIAFLCLLEIWLAGHAKRRHWIA